LGGGNVAGKVDHEIVTELRQFQRDPSTDAPRPASDESHTIHALTG
jgi:hypothetical protein